MSREFPTQDEVVSAAIAYFQVAHADPDTGAAPPVGPRTFLGHEARALAALIGELLGYAKGIDDDAIPLTYYDDAGTLRTRQSKRSIEEWADALGVPSGVPGKFGRRGAQTAKSGAATVVGPFGTPFATGATLTDPSGSVAVKVRMGFTIPLSGSASFVLDAVTAGEAGRLPAGTVLRWSAPPPGVAASLSLTTGLVGGYESESDVDLALRVVERLRNRPRSGSLADWKEWTLEATDSATGELIGAAAAWVYPHRDGAGSVTIVPTFGGSGKARDPGAAAVAKILAYVQSQKICTDTVYVLRPRFVAGKELTVTVTIEPEPGYGFDYKDTTPTNAIGGSGTSCVVDTTLALSLRAAVDNGNRPRIAIVFAGSEIPFVASVTAYQLNVPVLGTSTLTLSAAMPASPVGNRVYPAGSATLPIAAAISTYVNSLGPSRSSGFAGESWQDDVTIGQLARVALSAVSASGEKVARKSADVGLGVGITIAVGTGTASGADFKTWDNVPTQAPQLAELAAIIVKEAS